MMLLNLDSAVGSTHLTQSIDSPGISGETLITNKVTAISPDTPDKSMDCTMHALPTAESRLNHYHALIWTAAKLSCCCLPDNRWIGMASLDGVFVVEKGVDS
jgi:hypothetical protein